MPDVWATGQEGKIRYQQLSSADFEEAVALMEKAFWPYENLCSAMGVSGNEAVIKELSRVTKEVARDGITLVAKDSKTDKIVGAAFNRFLVRSGGQPDALAVVSESTGLLPLTRTVLKMVTKMENICDIFEECKVDRAFEVMMVGVLPEYRKRGISLKLHEVAIEMARKLSTGIDVRIQIDGERPELIEPQIVTLTATALATRKIAEKLGFQIAAEKKLDEVSYQGRTFSSIIGNGVTRVTSEYMRL